MRILNLWLVLALTVITAAGVVVMRHSQIVSATAWGSMGMPQRSADAAATPLGMPAAAPAGTGGYTFMMTGDDGSPLTWDACRPIHYVVNPLTAPPGADSHLGAALDRLSELTGYQFIYDGTTDELPSEDRTATDEDRYGDRFSPVLIAWVAPDTHAGLLDDVAGYAGPLAVGDSRTPMRYVSGQVVFDGPQIASVFANSAGVARGRAIIMHELAHLLGLEHVSDPSQLMYPSTTSTTVDFSDGDLRGLAAVAPGACY